MYQGMKIVLIAFMCDFFMTMINIIVCYSYYVKGGRIKPGFENLPMPTEIEVNDGFGYAKVKDLNKRQYDNLVIRMFLKKLENPDFYRYG